MDAKKNAHYLSYEDRERGRAWLFENCPIIKKGQKISITFFSAQNSTFWLSKMMVIFRQTRQFFGAIRERRGRRFENCLVKTKNKHYLFCTHSLLVITINLLLPKSKKMGLGISLTILKYSRKPRYLLSAAKIK